MQSQLPRAWIPELAFVGLGIDGALASAIRFRPTWTVWIIGNLILFTSTSFVLSVPRYSLILFPLVAWFGLLSRSRRVGGFITLASLCGLVFFAGRFALGDWAF